MENWLQHCPANWKSWNKNYSTWGCQIIGVWGFANTPGAIWWHGWITNDKCLNIFAKGRDNRILKYFSKIPHDALLALSMYVTYEKYWWHMLGLLWLVFCCVYLVNIVNVAYMSIQPNKFHSSWLLYECWICCKSINAKLKWINKIKNCKFQNQENKFRKRSSVIQALELGHNCLMDDSACMNNFY